MLVQSSNFDLIWYIDLLIRMEGATVFSLENLCQLKNIHLFNRQQWQLKTVFLKNIVSYILITKHRLFTNRECFFKKVNLFCKFHYSHWEHFRELRVYSVMDYSNELQTLKYGEIYDQDGRVSKCYVCLLSHSKIITNQQNNHHW